MNDDTQSIEDCNLFIRQTIRGNEFAAFQISFSALTSESIESSESNETAWTSFLTYQSQSASDAARFEYLTDTSSYDLDFQLKYYNPATPETETNEDDGDNCPSGAYIFKPAMDDQKSHTYSQFEKKTSIDNTFMHTDVLEYKTTD